MIIYLNPIINAHQILCRNIYYNINKKYYLFVVLVISYFYILVLYTHVEGVCLVLLVPKYIK